MLKGNITKMIKEFVETDRNVIFKSNEISFENIISAIKNENLKINNAPFKRFVEISEQEPTTELVYQ